MRTLGVTMVGVQLQRERIPLDVPGDPCQLCGRETVVTQSRTVRRGTAWLNPRWDPDIRVYELCASCGAKREIASHRAA